MKAESVLRRANISLRFALFLTASALVWFACLASGFAENEARADEEAKSSESKEPSAEDVAQGNGGNSWLYSGDRSERAKLEFRVDNVSRFIRREREKEYKSSTIFCDDLVFDFVGDNGEIVIYSFSNRKFALIDPIRRVRTELEEEEVDQFLERVKPMLREKDDGFTKFMTEPIFSISKKEDELFFQSKWIDYRATTRAFEDENVADAYFQFVNALGKLNVYMNPGVVTPLARIEANRYMEDASRFPEKVVAEIYPKGKSIFAKTATVENEATMSGRLAERDRNRINRALHFIEQFPFVNFRTYFEESSKR